jgi:ribosomal protein S18 acetylase RimI-like enzyme
VIVRLEPFHSEYADTIASWAVSAEEAEWWCARREHPVDPAVFAQWHTDPDVRPWVLIGDAGPMGYGEVWEDPGENEAELARLIVDPRERGHGVGRVLVELLSERAQTAGYSDIWVRVVPENTPALACYESAGFTRTTADEERLFNQDQPRDYVWMRLLEA